MLHLISEFCTLPLEQEVSFDHHIPLVSFRMLVRQVEK